MGVPSSFEVTAQDAYNYAASKGFTDQQLCMVIQFGGKLDRDVLAKAVRLTLDLEPILGCRFEENDDNPVWVRRSNLDQTTLCSMVETSLVEQDMQSFINAPIHADKDPLIATRIFRASSRDVLCIKLCHAVGDAGALKAYVAQLAEVYTALLNGEKVSVVANLGRRDQSQLFEHTKDPRSFHMTELPTPTWMLPLIEGTQPLHVFRQIRKGQFEVIKRYAQERHATINDMLLAAMYRVFFASNNTAEGKPMLMQVSIDLRRYLPDCKADAICNLSGALYVLLERKLDESFETTLMRVAEAMQKIKKDYPGIETAVGLEYLYGQGFAGLERYMLQSADLGKKFCVTFPLLSNFGVIRQYHFGNLEMLKDYISSPAMYYPGFMLGASTYNGEMTLSIGYCGEANTTQIQNFLDAYVAELPK